MLTDPLLDFLYRWSYEGHNKPEKNRYFFRLRRYRYDQFLVKQHSIWTKEN